MVRSRLIVCCATHHSHSHTLLTDLPVWVTRAQTAHPPEPSAGPQSMQSVPHFGFVIATARARGAAASRRYDCHSRGCDHCKTDRAPPLCTHPRRSLCSQTLVCFEINRFSPFLASSSWPLLMPKSAAPMSINGPIVSCET
jgi:hypothetical protein